MRRAIALALAALGAVTAPPAAGAIRLVSTTYQTGASGPDSVVVADLDGKHGPDIVASVPAAGKIVVRLNDGHGGFGAAHAYPTCTGSGLDVELADLIGPVRVGPDGHVDALVACGPGGVMLPGDGAGGFGPARPFPLGSSPTTPLHRWTPIALTRRRGGGSPLLSVLVDSFPNGRRACQLADLVTLSCEIDVRVDGPLVSGALIPGPASTVPYDQLFTAVYTPGTGRFDRLGILNVSRLPGQAPAWVLSPWPGGGIVDAIAVGDVTADGATDVVIAHQVSSVAPLVAGLSLYVGRPGGGLRAGSSPQPIRSAAGLVDVGIGDMDGDGRADIVAMGAFGRAVVHRALPGARFAPPVDVPLAGYRSPTWSTNGALKVADLNADGYPDLVVADLVARHVNVLLNRSPRLSPLIGLRDLRSTVRASSAGILALGTATSPPTSRVTIAVRADGKTIGSGAARLRAGATVALRARLTAAALARLRARGTWRASLVVVATGPAGSRTRTTAVTLRRP